jgi:DNA-directed RNA polymerase subunit RPC12/RpoP
MHLALWIPRGVHAGLEVWMMASQSEQLYGTYRCPVCGHRDAAELEIDEPSRVLECSYCSTPLEVMARGPESVRFSVKVAEEPLHG